MPDPILVSATPAPPVIVSVSPPASVSVDVQEAGPVEVTVTEAVVVLPGVTSPNNSIRIFAAMTQEEFDAITPPDNQVTYIID